MNKERKLDKSNSIVSNTLGVGDVASKLVEEGFYKVKDIINIYTYGDPGLKKEVTTFFNDLLDHAGNLEQQLLEAICENEIVDMDMHEKYLSDWHSQKYRTLIYKKILGQGDLNALKTKLDGTEKDLFLEIISEFLFRKYNLGLIKKENLINVLSYLYPEKDTVYINNLIKWNTESDRDYMVKYNKYALENVVYDDELYKEIIAAKKRLDNMLANFTMGGSDFADSHLLKKHKVAGWEKYDEYLKKYEKKIEY